MTASTIHELNESNSRLHKEAVLDRVLVAAKLGNTNARIFLGLANACYNPMITWGVKVVPDTVGIQGAQNPWQEFNNLLQALGERRLTGNAARDAIADIAYRFDSDEWNNFCAPVLRKDLRAGITSTTINKIVKNTEWEIPVFSCQLATSCDDRPEMRGLKRLEPKLDGVRVLMMVSLSDDGVHTVAFSRNGKQFENFGHIEDQLQQIAPHIVAATGISNSFILDGEVVGQSFQELMRVARRKKDVDSEDTTFHIFDIVPLRDFERGQWKTPLSQRVSMLNTIKQYIELCPNVALLEHLMVNLDTQDGMDQFDSYCREKVAQGYEGVMIKDMNGFYKCKRTTDWLKYKPTITVDLTVVGLEEGTGRNVGRLGAMVCSGVDGDRNIVVNVGSGFSDEQRVEFWDSADSVVGRVVEVMADAITQNQDGTWSLRFPRWMRFRDTLTGEKE